MVKLEAKDPTTKQSKMERRRKQKEREQELNQILELQKQGTVDPEQILKIAAEGGEVQASDVTKSDLRRL